MFEGSSKKESLEWVEWMKIAGAAAVSRDWNFACCTLYPVQMAATAASRSVRVASYNVLGKSLARTDWFPHVTKEVLRWSARWPKLVGFGLWPAATVHIAQQTHD